jgi:hypothetical protein
MAVTRSAPSGALLRSVLRRLGGRVGQRAQGGCAVERDGAGCYGIPSAKMLWTGRAGLGTVSHAS